MASTAASSPLFTKWADQNVELQIKGISGTAADIGTVTLDKSPQSAHYIDRRFVIAGLTGETITIKGWLVGGGGTLTAALIPIVASTGLPHANGNLGNGEYIIPKRWNFYGFTFTKSNTVETGRITWGSVSMPKV